MIFGMELSKVRISMIFGMELSKDFYDFLVRKSSFCKELVWF